jgi:4-amino-4-deoxy-L-arabinose transferase-like glycosyltransferase
MSDASGAGDTTRTIPVPCTARPFIARLTTPTALLVASLVVIGLLRLGTLGTMALTDNTEARYAGISWNMFRSGDWVTPRVYLSGELVPFWAKPPLFFWMTTLSFEACGASEWSARLPNALLAIAVVVMTIAFGRRFWGLRVGLLAGLILASSGLFFGLAGSCVLDMSLAASVTCALMSFALFASREGVPPVRMPLDVQRKTLAGHRLREPAQMAGPRQWHPMPQMAGSQGTWWGRAFFFSLALGGLAKGPVALVLVGLAAGAWIAASGRWTSASSTRLSSSKSVEPRLLRRLPWITGILILIAVVCPWYIAAERATPGFLKYFLLNEHLLRYVRAEYGDLYGAGRTQPYGASWLMLAVTFLPWSPLFVRYGIESWRGRKSGTQTSRDAWVLFALIWGLTPVVFFTFCRQILVTYLLPGFPGLALAMAVFLNRWLEAKDTQWLLRGLRWTAVGMGVAIGAGLVAEGVMGVAPWAIVGTMLAFVFFGAIAWHGHTRAVPSVLLAAMGQGTALLMAMAIFASAGYVEEAYSAKTILASLSRLPQYAACDVVLPFGDEYSADFYQEAWLGRRLEHNARNGLKLLVDAVHHRHREVFVLRRREWQDMEPAVRQSLTPIAETDHWIACRGLPADGTSQASKPRAGNRL